MHRAVITIGTLACGAILGAAGSQAFARTRTHESAIVTEEHNHDRQTNMPPGEADAKTRLAASPRHGEWVMIKTGPGPTDSIRSWVVYPSRSTKAPVVLVVHEIFGLTPWVRS